MEHLAIQAGYGLILLPLAGAFLCLLAPRSWSQWIGNGVSILLTLLAGVAAMGVAIGGAGKSALGGWEAPLGIVLRIDGLAAVFLLLTALIALPAGLYATFLSRAEDAKETGSFYFWPLWFFLWTALNGIFLSTDLFNLYVLLEVMGTAAVALTVLKGSAQALTAGLRYLLAGMAASMAYLFGVALIYAQYGSLSFDVLAPLVESNWTTGTAIALIIVGLLVKTALFPFHFWLPPAHSSAQPPVSAILSALVVKASFYIILRLWIDVFEGSLTYAAGQLLGALGAAGVVWGSYQALRQERLKRMVAHSTVGQVGYLFLLFPLITVAPGTEGALWLPHAWAGGIYQALAHAFAKAALFLSVGVVILATGSDHRSGMRNLVGRLPMTTFAIALAGISLIGLPPSGGFVAKWMLLKASFASGQWWWAPMIVWGSFLTAGYVFMVLRIAFAPAGNSTPLRRVPRSLEVTALLLGIGAIVIGLRATEVLALLDVAAPYAEAVDPGNGGDQ